MTKFMLTSVAFVAGTVTAIAQVDPRWTREVGLDFWNLEDVAAWHQAEVARTGELAVLSEQCRRRSEALDAITARLVEGQISLTQGVKQLEQLAQADAEWFAMVFVNFGGGLPREKVVPRFLLMKVRAVGWNAEGLRQTTRAGFIANRLTQLEVELRVLPASPQPARGVGR